MSENKEQPMEQVREQERRLFRLFPPHSMKIKAFLSKWEQDHNFFLIAQKHKKIKIKVRCA